MCVYCVRSWVSISQNFVCTIISLFFLVKNEYISIRIYVYTRLWKTYKNLYHSKLLYIFVLSLLLLVSSFAKKATMSTLELFVGEMKYSSLDVVVAHVMDRIYIYIVSLYVSSYSHFLSLFRYLFSVCTRNWTCLIKFSPSKIGLIVYESIVAVANLT